jgi:ATP-binding cassette subfamily B protein
MRLRNAWHALRRHLTRYSNIFMSTPQAPATNHSQLKEALIRSKRSFYYVGLFSLCMNITLFALPIYSLQVLDRVMSSHSLSTLFWLTLVTVGLLIFYGLFNAIKTAVLNKIGEWMELHVAPELLSGSVLRSSLGLGSSGSQNYRDLTMVKSFVTGGGISTLFDAPWAVLFLLAVYMINPVLGFVTLMGCFVLFGLAILTEVATKKPVELASKAGMRVNTIAETATRNAEMIEAMGMIGNIAKDWKDHNQRNLDLQAVGASRSNMLYSTSRILRMVIQVAITGVGAWLALENQMTMGGMIASSILASRALSPFESAIGVWKSWLMAREAYHRLDKSFANLGTLRGTIDLPAPTGHIMVEQLVYRPITSQTNIIKGVAFEIKPGEAVGIIGPSAAGKSTLAKLLIGVLPPSNGTVRLDGADIFKWNRQHLGKYVGYMPQDVELFSGTIKDNIARMDKSAPIEKVIEAAQKAYVHDMILQLPHGYETEYTFGNINLSPGQRQRIGLAMALYGNPKYIVLDEPNSNLDGDGERALLQAMNYIRSQGTTLVVVAHRPSIVSAVDKILSMRAGVVEAYGPRDQVLQRYVAAASPMQQPQQPKPQNPPQLAAGAQQ